MTVRVYPMNSFSYDISKKQGSKYVHLLAYLWTITNALKLYKKQLHWNKRDQWNQAIF